MNKLHSHSLREDVCLLFQALVGQLPPGCASLRVTESSEATEGVDIIELVPSSPQAARITARVDEGHAVTLSIGEGAVYEIPERGIRYTSLPCTDEIKAICSAVINGRFEETLSLKRSDIVQAVGKLDVAGKTVASHWRQLFTNPFVRKEKRHIQYQPYCPGSEVR